MIVRGCPCVYLCDEKLNMSSCYKKTLGNKDKLIFLERCCDITDCKIKQVVELCKRNKEDNFCYDCVYDGEYHKAILQLLDVQEVEL